MAINGNLFKRRSNWITLYKRRLRSRRKRVTRSEYNEPVLCVLLRYVIVTIPNLITRFRRRVAVKLIALIDRCGIPRARAAFRFAPLSCTSLSRGRGGITILTARKLSLGIASSDQLELYNVTYFTDNLNIVEQLVQFQLVILMVNVY